MTELKGTGRNLKYRGYNTLNRQSQHFATDLFAYLVQSKYPDKVMNVINAIQVNKTMYKLKSGLNCSSLKWIHLANGIKHLLYDEMAESFMIIINNNKKYKSISSKDIDDILTELQKKTNINENEMNYIREIIKNTLKFEPVTHGMIL